MHDPVYKPYHYTQGDIECIDAMVEAFGDDQTAIYCKLNAFKYLWRSDLKNPDSEDIEKAGPFKGHPLTGPVYVRDAAPGDVLTAPSPYGTPPLLNRGTRRPGKD